MFAIIAVEEDLDIVPTNWIFRERVWLPKKRYGFKFNQMLGNRKEPEEDWIQSEAVIRMEYGNRKKNLS